MSDTAPARTRDATLLAKLSGRDNDLNFVRLVMAAAVIVAHTWDVCGLGFGPMPGGMSIGGWAVAGFFTISGFLITGSRLATTLPDYLLRRVLRIFPGFWACLVVVAFGFAPLAAYLGSGTMTVNDAVAYVRTNFLLVGGNGAVGNTLHELPVSLVWNAPLWTLGYEFAAYLTVGLLLSVVRSDRLRAISLSTFLALGTIALIVVHVRGSANSVWTNALWLGCFFLAGATLRMFGDHIPASPVLGMIAIGVLTVLAFTPLFRVVGHLPMAYATLWAGSRLTTGIGRRNDVSYGTYIYAFPIQQTLAVLGVQHPSPVLHWAASTALTLPVAWASWRLVEKPAMRWRRLFDRWIKGGRR